MKNVSLLVWMIVLLVTGCASGEKQYVIGVSQCSDDEWRTQLNEEIQREMLFYPNARVEILSVADNSARQVRDIESLLARKVDLLVVSPNEADAVAPVLEKAYNAGVPVVLVDRKIHSDKYTAFVGADNRLIGRSVGEYIVNRLEGKGTVIELAGLKGSTPAADRHDGMMEVLSESPQIRLLCTADAGWLKDSAEEKFDSLLRVYPQISLVFAHNDRMAAGAWEAARKVGRERDILFVGIDALPGKGYGLEQIQQGRQEASFIYSTGGDKVIQLAMNILRGKPYPKEIKLSTALVDKSNARIMLMQREHILTLDEKIELLTGQLDMYLMRYSEQRMFLYACIVIIVLVAALLFIVVRAFWMKNRLNAELSAQKQQLEKQRDQLIRMSEKVEEATRTKLAFFTNVSHDFRTPLTLISDPVSQLLENNRLDEPDRSLLTIVQKNVKVLLRLINQILDFRKFEDGKLVLHLSQFDMSVDIREWTEAFRVLSYRKHVRFSVNVADADSGYIMVADAEKLERITYNLLSNAFKFTPENGTIAVALSVVMKEGVPWLRYQVSDTGIGMSAEHIQHVFESFYQIGVHFGGSGVGLALVKAFVEMHHGHIEVDSCQDKGTIFTIEMPMKQEGEPEGVADKNVQRSDLKEGAVLAADQETLVAGERPEGTGPTGALPKKPADKETVLIIDDNQDIRDYVRALLQEEYIVIEAANGQEGIRQALKYVPDAIVCDVMMPIMDGMECCRRLKSELQTSHIPVMMLTAYAMDEYKIQGYECGADSYILKPFSAKLLKVRLRNLIDNRRLLKGFFSDKTMLQKEPIAEMDKGFVEKLRALIESHLSDAEVSVEDLGGEMGLSRVQLYRKAKALTGYSPNELLRIARLKRASLLLASTEKTIAEITYEVGFSSPSYFTKCYKEYFGESPTDFLKRK